MNSTIESEYYSVGGNRHSASADWSNVSGLLAFGADQNVALWSPSDPSARGISALLTGHTAQVTAVKFLEAGEDGRLQLFVTGAADGVIAAWEVDAAGPKCHRLAQSAAHEGTINAIAALGAAGVFVTGGADAKVRLWRVCGGVIEPLSTLLLTPRFIPLGLVLGPLLTSDPSSSLFVAVSGTRNDVHIYAVEKVSKDCSFSLCATLSGHDSWVRSLALTSRPDDGFLLASASQDKFVRIWHFRPGVGPADTRHPLPAAGPVSDRALTAKTQRVSAGGVGYSISFEALLVGHDDWIYSAAWSPNIALPQLLTASADGSVSIWESDPASGVWLSISRMGEISGQKGATTATGSAGGFWNGLWSPDGSQVTCLGRTGGWRLWKYNDKARFWSPSHAVGGHVSSVNGICWATDGGYLLSTSSDQTTRLHAEWKRGLQRSWHEFSRPQIHGYDLNCVASTNPHQFSSGADEKLLRVFDAPKDVAVMLHSLCDVRLAPDTTLLPERAAMPVLGLSNKAMTEDDDLIEGAPDTFGSTAESASTSTLLPHLQEPPTEDLLSRHTLWPEYEKLYGHGYEISDATASCTDPFLATACKASSVEHAAIRLYDTRDWTELKPPLMAHSLTVTRVAFSHQPAGYLLSVSRDRSFAVFRQGEDHARAWTMIGHGIKAHSRMILDCAWLTNIDANLPTFATGGRDKTVRIWVGAGHTESSKPVDAGQAFTCKISIVRKSPVTAISAIQHGSTSLLAIGEDDGRVSIHLLHCGPDIMVVGTSEIPPHLCPSKTATKLAWRPRKDGYVTHGDERLAIASADGSLRILKIHSIPSSHE